MALDDVVILNVDTNTLETPFDDLQSLPNDVVGIWAHEDLTSVSSCKEMNVTLGNGEGEEIAKVFLWPENCSLFLHWNLCLSVES